MNLSKFLSFKKSAMNKVQILSKQSHIYTANRKKQNKNKKKKSLNAKYRLLENSIFLQLVTKKGRCLADFWLYNCICTHNQQQTKMCFKKSV